MREAVVRHMPLGHEEQRLGEVSTAGGGEKQAVGERVLDEGRAARALGGGGKRVKGAPHSAGASPRPRGGSRC